MARTFTDNDAATSRKGKQLPLMIGLISPSSGGKTFSALRLAKGMQSVVGGDIFVIDTEQDRALHYADDFQFRHVPFGEPYGSEDYLEAFRYCKAKSGGKGVLVVDQVSYEHDGPGGLLEQHEAELDRMAGNDWKKRDRVAMAAWIKPKARRKKMMNYLVTEMNMPVIFCWRAKESTKPVPGGQPLDLGYTSIGAIEWKFDMTANIMFYPNANGVPNLQSDKIGEKACIKIPKQFAWLYDHRGPIDEEVGRRMAQWAVGGSQSQATATTQPRQTPDQWLSEHLFAIDAATSTDALDAIEAKAKAALLKLGTHDANMLKKAENKMTERRAELSRTVDTSDPFETVA